MPELFKPDRPYPLPSDAVIIDRDNRPHIRMRERGKIVHYPLSKDGTKYLKPGPKWAADVRVADGTRKRVRFSPNKDAASVMLADMLKQIENEKAGIIDHTTRHRKRPLGGHLEDWLDSLRANGRDDAYVQLKASRVRSVIDGCGWVFTNDMSADRLETFLAALRSRRPELPPIPPGVESFSGPEVGRLLGGICRQTVSILVKRHQLERAGRGKSRRFPRATVESLRQLRDHGLSVQTTNHYLQAAHQFARWLGDNGRINHNPFRRVKSMNARLDQRRRRGELAPREIGDILNAAAMSTVTVSGLAGTDRVMLYRVALGTGFRAAELAALTPEMFDLIATPPIVILPAEHTKNRKGAVQPLSASLSSDLRQYIEGRPRKASVWPGKWSLKAADMLRVDLVAAEIPLKVDGPEGMETRDFHALRYCYISDVLRSGADVKQAMTLARHSDPRLTTARYGRTRIQDLGAVVDKLPNSDQHQDTEPVALRLTGTDSGAAMGAAIGDDERGLLRKIEDNDGESAEDNGMALSLEMQADEDNRGSTETIEEKGPTRIRTGDDGFANRCLTTWLSGQTLSNPSGHHRECQPRYPYHRHPQRRT